MPYAHTTVADVEQGQAEHAEVERKRFAMDQKKLSGEYVAMLDGVPYVRQLVELCEQLRAEHPLLRFGPLFRGSRAAWMTTGSLLAETWAYFPGQEYALMRLGYADYNIGSKTKSSFGVYARHINNTKFSPERDQRYMMLTDSPERALQNARKAMRPYSVVEVSHMSRDTFVSLLGRTVSKAARAYNEAMEGVVNNPSFLSEMRVIVSSGYKFLDPQMEVKMKEMLAAFDEQMKRANEHSHGYFVQVREYLGEQVFDVIFVPDMRRNRTPHTPPRICKADELDSIDANLAGRIAALSMLDSNAFVDGVGYRVSPTSFWVMK